MLETTQNAAEISAQQGGQKPRKILKMVKNSRTAGSMPAWVDAKTAKEKTENTLAMAQHGHDANIVNGLAYSPQDAPIHHEEFGFGDLVDMVNPLHHIPVVGHVYREITGDDIKPIGKMIGGAVFGGPAGAAMGLVNVAVEAETGKDIGENAMALALNGEMPSFKNNKPLSDNPEKRLNDAVKATAYDDLPGNLLAFADLGGGNAGIQIERLAAPTPKAYPHEKLDHLPAREPITTVNLKPMPKNQYRFNS